MLTDATVAIALTVLVLPLVDDAANLNENVSLGRYLADNAASLGAFVVTFAVMCSLWLIHRRTAADVVPEGGTQPGIVWATFVWLAAIVLLPLWSQLLWNGGDDRAVDAAYIATIGVAVAAMGVVRLILIRHPEVRAPNAGTHLTGTLITLGLILVALVLAVTVPAVGMWALLLLVASGPLTTAIERRRQ